MWFSRKQVSKLAVFKAQVPPVQPALTGIPHASEQPTTNAPDHSSTKKRGDAAEAAAAAHLQCAGLTLIERNFRTPGRGGGEIDLVMRAPDGTLVFVEVRQRASASHGGAGASIGQLKQQRIVLAAQHYLMRFARVPPCRFDVVLVEGVLASAGAKEGPNIEWLVAAFDAF
ncbi:MAG: YraN family protein [Polaromonas sp.]|nr:YraN family protein [Polaromonas sp.]